MMETERIKQLMERYFEGQSNRNEETQLHDYFASNKIDAELLPYRVFFQGIEEMKSKPDSKLEDELMDFILESEHREKTKLRYLWQSVSVVAAVVLIALLVVNYSQNRSTWKDTYSDPNQAYVEASKTLQFVSEKYQKGLAQLRPLDKVRQAVQPLDKGMNSVNKGFQEMKNLKQINQKFKQE